MRRDQLLELLTTAAAIGMDQAGKAQVTGDLTRAVELGMRPQINQALAGSRPLNYEKFAYMLVQRYFAVQEAREANPRSKACAVADAALRGAYRAADRLGLASTDTEMEMAVIEAVRAAADAAPRPQWHPMNAQPRRDYDNAMAADIVKRMGWEA